jgi:hypothetical protein
VERIWAGIVRWHAMYCLDKARYAKGVKEDDTKEGERCIEGIGSMLIISEFCGVEASAEQV